MSTSSCIFQKLRAEILDSLDSQIGDLFDEFVHEVEHIDEPNLPNGSSSRES